MWSKLPPRFVARMLSGHTVTGLAASALLYVLCLSGTVMVFHEEFARWEQPDVPEFREVTPGVVHAAALNGLERSESPHHYMVGLPVGTMPRITVIADEKAWYADETGALVDEVHHPFAEFIEHLHYYLTLPSVLGLTLVGILGVLMTALVFSGVLSHPKLFRDAFSLRLKGNARLRETDLHNRFGVWAAPFHLVVAFTGAVLGLATVVALVLGMTVFQGDPEDFFAPIFGAEPEGAKTAAPLANVTNALNNFERQHPDILPWWISFHDPATEGQSAEILAQHPRRVIYGDNYQFDASGELLGNTGLSDGYLGQQVAASLYPLHFGSFGGIWVKLAYGVLGILSCVMIASGFNIWLLKRRQRGRAAPALERGWQATLWGTPAAMALIMLLVQAGVDSAAMLVGAFWIALLAAVSLAIAGVVVSGPRLRAGAGFMLAASLVVHAASYAGELDRPVVAGVSVTLLVAAGWLLRDMAMRFSRGMPGETVDAKWSERKA